MKVVLFGLAAAGIVSGAAIDTPLFRRQNSNSTSGPVIDLGSAGRYRGIIQNNGTVASFKGIPYAQPPVGNLRFKGPKALAAQNSTIVDVSDDAIRCVQFDGGSAGNIVGVKAGPGQEDCLKVWIWAPANATSSSNLPVQYYVHGGGLQYSAAANNDFSDWVSQGQNFIAVNVAYRLGALGFFASDELTAEGENANAGLLDQRQALAWTRSNIKAFGGNPNQITIMGQSGGGYAVACQMALYDGNNDGLFNRAIPRSVQRSPMFKTSELSGRNAAWASLLNCTGSSQLACFRNATVQQLRDTYTTLGRQQILSTVNGNQTYGTFAGFLPTVDGVTLTDTLSRLFQLGRFVKIPTLVGAVNDEGAQSPIRNQTAVLASANGVWNLSSSRIDQVISYYAVNTTFGSSAPDNFFLSYFKATIQSLNNFGENGITGSERLIARSVAQYFDPSQVWSFRFNAPTVGTSRGLTPPLNYVTHSADNSFLQNATSVMTPYEVSMANEWRGYIGSFVRTGSPNTQKLGSAPTWPAYGALGSYDSLPVRLVPTFAFSSNANSTQPTSTQPEIVQRAQLERMGFWLDPQLLIDLKL